MYSSPHTQRTDRGGDSLIVKDLCAQIAPLNRYGLPGLGNAVADGLRYLIGASRTAFGAVLARAESH
jgi:hypothetical protein